MNINFNKIKRMLGVDSLEDQLNKCKTLEKSYYEIDKKLDSLSEEFYIEKSLYEKRLKNEEDEFIKSRIKERFNKFVELHKDEIRKTKAQYSKIKKSYENLKSDKRIAFALEEIRKSEAFSKIKKAYKDGDISVESYNTIIKSVTKSDVTKYADFVLFNEQNQILILKRSVWEDDHQGAWVIPGGHVDPGEDFETAAKRELMEESGFVVKDCKNIGQYKDDKAHIEYFSATINTNENQPVLDYFEARDLRWIDLDEIYDYEMVFNMKDNLIKMLDIPKKDKKYITKNTRTNILGSYGDKVLEIIESALKDGKKRDYIEKLKRLKERRDPDNIEEDFIVDKSELDQLYFDFFDEIKKSETKKNFLIEKGFIEEAEKLGEEIEKAKKDISKLNKIKKLIYRDGKIVYATYYVKTGELDEEKEKVTYTDIIDQNLQQGDRIEFTTSRRIVRGELVNINYNPKTGGAWLGVYNEKTGKVVWSPVKAMKVLKKLSGVGEDKYKVIKSLGGSTGAVLVEDTFGNKYVRKTGADKEHIKREYEALKLYNYLGVDVPAIHKFDPDKGELYTQYIEDGKTIIEYGNISESNKALKENFGVDALLANWDVMGLNYDNVLVSANEWGLNPKFFRVDVGGSLDKRAQGGEKEFGSEVKELETLLDPKLNPQASNTFLDVDVLGQVKETINKWEKAKEDIANDPNISNVIKETIANRIQYMKDYVKKNSSELSENHDYNFKGKLYDFNPTQTPKEVIKFYDKLNEDLRITDKDLEVLNKNKYYTESYANEHIESYVNKELIDEAKKAGVSPLELYIVREFTGSDYHSYNDLSKSMTTSPSGNINFNKEKLHYGKIPTEKVKVSDGNNSFSMKGAYETLLLGVKSANFKKDNGLSMSEMNKVKYDNIFKKFEEINEIKKKVPEG